jgi:hypothetical protein
MMLNLRNNGKINKMICFSEDFCPSAGFRFNFLDKTTAPFGKSIISLLEGSPEDERKMDSGFLSP